MNYPSNQSEVPRWRDAERAATILASLEALGFRPDARGCEVESIGLRALGLLHAERKRFAAVYEANDDGVWFEVGAEVRRCKLDKNTWGRKAFIATTAKVQRESISADRAIVARPEATAEQLLETVASMLDGLPAETLDDTTFALVLHGRLYRRHAFLEEAGDVKRRAALIAERDKRLRRWVRGFVKYFRAMGFLRTATRTSDAKLATMIVDCQGSLFETFGGVEAVVDDYDELSDLFGEEELQSMPGTAQLADLKLLAVLDPRRVWWSYRLWDFDLGYRESDVTIDAATYLGSLADVSAGAFAPRDFLETRGPGHTSVVKFVLDGESCSIPFRYEASAESLSRSARVIAPNRQLLDGINDLVASREARFRMFDFSGDEDYFKSRYIIFLTDGECSLLERDRGWTLS